MHKRQIGNSSRNWYSQKEFVVDLGTQRTRVMQAGSRAVFDQPSIWIPKHELYGSRVEELEGRSVQSQHIVHPVKLGVISEPQVAGEYLHQILIDEFGRSVPSFLTSPLLSGLFFSPKGVIIVPTTATAVEKQGAIMVGQNAGLSDVRVYQAGVAVSRVLEYPTALICILGAGMTEISLISAGEVVFSHALPDWTGNQIDTQIIHLVEKRHQLEITPATARQLKHQLANFEGESPSASTGQTSAQSTSRSSFIARGKDQKTGLPISIRVEASFLSKYLDQYLEALVENMTTSLEEIPASILVEVLEQGIMLAGGGALLPGLAPVLSGRLRMPVQVVKDPELAVIRGANT